MRVVCIDDSERDEFWPSAWKLKEGSIYTVIWTGIVTDKNGHDSGYGYSLAEDPDNEEYAWCVDRFIPLSSIDETQMERNYDKIKQLT